MSVEDIIFLMRKDKVRLIVIIVMFVKLTLSYSYKHGRYYMAVQIYTIFLLMLKNISRVHAVNK